MAESPPHDVLSELLGAYQITAKVFAQPLVCGGWRIDTNGVATTQFHLLVRGTCFLQMKHLQRPLPLRPGDLVMVPNGDWHILSAHPLANDEPTETGGATSQLLCGSLLVPDAARKALFGFLPPALVVRASEVNERFARLVQLIAAEAQEAEAGSQSVLDALSNALVTLTLREHFRAAPESTQKGVLAALQDGRLRNLVAAIHREPGRAWCVDAMLELAPMSRSALMERFKLLLGDGPMGYVTQIRMIEARRLLADASIPKAQVAQRIGYDSEAAFRRAYRRFITDEGAPTTLGAD